MALKQCPPSEIAQCLAAESIDVNELLLCTNTDIDNLGTYKQLWLAVSTDHVFVVSDSTTPKLELRLEISNVTEFRCQGTIGSGLLQARVDGCFIDILRYSNRLADRFGKVARKLDHYLKGQPIVIYPEDDIDPRRCATCGLMLQFIGDTCPRCVNRGAVLSRMWALMRPYRMAALVVMGFLVVGICLDLVAPQLTRYLVDNVLPGQQGGRAEISV